MGDDFPPPWYRHLQRILREQEAMRRMIGGTDSMRQMIEQSEQLRRTTELLRISSSSALAEISTLPDYEHILGTTMRSEAFLLAGREHGALLEGAGRTAGSYLAAMEEAQRTAALTRSLLPALELDQALTKLYDVWVAKDLAPMASSLDSLSSLREAAARIGTFRTAIEIGVARAGISPALQSAIATVDQITSGAIELWSGIADDLDGFASIPAPLREIPVLLAFETSRDIALLFSDDDEVIEARPSQSLVAARAASLPERLRELHPKLAEKYEGVLHAMEVRGPDYISQVAASARELLKFVVEMLAPEDAVLTFNPTAKRGADGKLTRRALLEYIFRRVAASEDYAKMVSGQVDLILGSWYPLNAAVHALDPDLEHDHIESLIIQIEFGLIELLHASDA